MRIGCMLALGVLALPVAKHPAVAQVPPLNRAEGNACAGGAGSASVACTKARPISLVLRYEGTEASQVFRAVEMGARNFGLELLPLNATDVPDSSLYAVVEVFSNSAGTEIFTSLKGARVPRTVCPRGRMATVTGDAPIFLGALLVSTLDRLGRCARQLTGSEQ